MLRGRVRTSSARRSSPADICPALPKFDVPAVWGGPLALTLATFPGREQSGWGVLCPKWAIREASSIVLMLSLDHPRTSLQECAAPFSLGISYAETLNEWRCRFAAHESEQLSSRQECLKPGVAAIRQMESPVLAVRFANLAQNLRARGRQV